MNKARVKIDHHPFNNELQIRFCSSASETRNFPFSNNSNLPFGIRDPEFPLQQQPESTLQQDSPSAATRIYPSASETLNLLFRSRHPKSPLQQRQTELPQHNGNPHPPLRRKDTEKTRRIARQQTRVIGIIDRKRNDSSDGNSYSAATKDSRDITPTLPLQHQSSVTAAPQVEKRPTPTPSAKENRTRPILTTHHHRNGRSFPALHHHLRA